MAQDRAACGDICGSRGRKPAGTVGLSLSQPANRAELPKKKAPNPLRHNKYNYQ